MTRTTADVIHRVVIRGRVQGVGFRAWTQAMANRCNLEGWVRNRRDGSVEALFAGLQDVVLAMIELSRIGPPGARVESIDQREASGEDLALRRAGESFSVLASV
ncbi:MAG: acylphosphatase [Xanthobacteraceae bacterium]